MCYGHVSGHKNRLNLYLSTLQYGRANIESAIKRKDSSSDCASDTDDEEVDHDNKEKTSVNGPKIVDSLEIPKKNGIIKKVSSSSNIGNGNGNSVISKESLILVPDKTISTNVIQSNGNGNGKESPELQNNNNDDDEVII